MAKTLKVTVTTNIIGSYLNADVMSQPGDVFRHSHTTELAPGAGDGQADRMYRAERSLASGASEDLDPVGVLVDIFGEVLSLSKVKLIRIEADPTNATTLTVRRKAATGLAFLETAGDGFLLEAGGHFEIGSPKAGFAAAPGSDIIEVVNSAGATAKYKIIIVGVD